MTAIIKNGRSDWRQDIYRARHSLAVVCLFTIAAFFFTFSASAEPVIRITIRTFERPVHYPFFDDDGLTDTMPIRIRATREIETVMVGEDFIVKILVEDVRSPSLRKGVFASYVDVNFDNPARASLVPNLPFTNHPQTGNSTPYLHNILDPPSVFGNGAQPGSGTGLIDTNNDSLFEQIDAVGSFSGLFQGSGAGPFVLVEWAMRAENVGSLSIIAEPTTQSSANDPHDAGQSPLFDTLLFEQDLPVCPSQAGSGCLGEMEFIGAKINIIARNGVDETWTLYQ